MNDNETPTLRRIPRPDAPLAVGDCVRWTSPASAALWADGRITVIHDNAEGPSSGPPETCVMRIERVSLAWSADKPPTGSHQVLLKHIRRIVQHPSVAAAQPPADPLDVIHDGVSLRNLMLAPQIAFTQAQRSALAAQRAAVSAHWSAELRARIASTRAASSARRPSVTYCELDAED